MALSGCLGPPGVWVERLFCLGTFWPQGPSGPGWKSIFSHQSLGNGLNAFSLSFWEGEHHISR